MAAMYPARSATSRHDQASRADPSAVRYRCLRMPPAEPLPSAMLSTTLLAERFNWEARSPSWPAMARTMGRMVAMASSITS